MATFPRIQSELKSKMILSVMPAPNSLQDGWISTESTCFSVRTPPIIRRTADANKKGYFDSLNDPLTDPLTLWLTGGPGVSSIVGKSSQTRCDKILILKGILLELGPCRINIGGQGTHRNPYSWTRNSSMLFVDQPVGTGLSYTDPGVEIPSTSAIGAEDLYIFLQIFLTEVFPEKRQVPFHISGESFAVCQPNPWSVQS